MKHLYFFLFSVTGVFAQSTGLKLTDQKILDQVDNARPRLYGAKPGSSLPKSYDLSSLMPPPGSQGSMGSCAGWACAYALKTSHEKVEMKWELVSNNKLVTAHVFSPAFIYNQVNGGKDQGSYFSDIFKLLQEKGCATLSSTPYVEGDFTTQPSAKALAEAQSYKIAWAKDINASETGTLKSYISNGYPIIIGASVDDNFSDVKPGQIITSMQDGGGHAMIVVGYDDTKSGGCFKIMNSWGQDWGDKGFCWMTYDAFSKCVHEAWLVEDAETGKKLDVPVDDNNKPYPEDKDDKTETFNFDDEIPVFVELDSIESVDDYEEFSEYGAGVVFSGYIDVDKDAGSKAQVVLYFSDVEDEEDLLSCTDENFSDINDDLVAYTDEFTLSEWLDSDGEYEIFVPAKFLNASGKEQILVIPVLYIDGIDVAHGELVELSDY